MPMDDEEYDVILVGAGVGGCVMAQSILDEGLNHTILMIERGDEPGPLTENIEDIAPIHLAIGRNISSTPGQAQPQRSPRSYCLTYQLIFPFD